MKVGSVLPAGEEASFRHLSKAYDVEGSWSSNRPTLAMIYAEIENFALCPVLVEWRHFGPQPYRFGPDRSESNS